MSKKHHFFWDVGAAEFSPLALTSLAFWTRGDLGTYQSEGGAAATLDGDPIGQWQDQSGNTRHAVQATTALKPTLRPTAVASQPSDEGDGGDILVTPSFALAAVHCFVILKIASHASVRMVVEHGSDAFNNPGFAIITGAPGGGAGTSVKGDSARVIVAAPSADWWNDGTVVCAEVRASSAGVSIYKNGALGASSATDPGAISSQVLNLFARTGAAIGTVGHVAEVVLCSAVQSAGDITDLYAYFTDRYGITF